MDTRFYDNALELCKAQLQFYQSLLDGTMKTLKETIDGLDSRIKMLENSIITNNLNK